MTAQRSSTLILGLGNPIKSDDGVGIIVARRVHASLPAGYADLAEAATGGIALLELIAGYEKAIIIDAMRDPDGQVGDVRALSPADLGQARDPSSFHEVDVPTALALGRELEIELPSEVAIYGIVAHELDAWGEGLTGELEERLPGIVKEILSRELAAATGGLQS